LCVSIEVVMRTVWWSFSWSLVALSFFGCGGDDNGPLSDPNTFAGMYAAAITKNCSMIAECNDRNNMPNSSNFEDDCAQQSADALNNNPDNQRQFVAKYIKCEVQTQSCAYVDCLMLPPGFGASQLPKIQQSCQASAACNAMTGSSPMEQIVCEGKRIGELDNYTIDQRNAYQAEYAGCATLTGCEFITCFPY
jgi:hypothetical protein